MTESLALYMKDVAQSPLLTHEQLIELARRHQRGDTKATEAIIKANLRLVIKIALTPHFLNRGLEKGELISEGNIGLMRAIDKFDPDKGFHFSTFAVWEIRRAVECGIFDKGPLIRPPAYIQKAARKAVAIWLNEVEGGKDTTLEQVIEAMPDRFATDLVLLGAGMNMSVVPQENNERGEPIYDAPYESEEAESAAIAQDMTNYLASKIDTLPPSEKKVIEVMYMQGGSLTDAGAALGGKTAEWARQLHLRAIKRLREATAAEQAF